MTSPSPARDPRGRPGKEIAVICFLCTQRWTTSCPRAWRRPLAPAATVINAACSALAMAAQVVQEAPGGGDGAGRAVDGLGGGAGRGSLHAGDDRGGVGDQVAGFLHDAGAGRDVHPELVRGGGVRADVVLL